MGLEKEVHSILMDDVFNPTTEDGCVYKLQYIGGWILGIGKVPFGMNAKQERRYS